MTRVGPIYLTTPRQEAHIRSSKADGPRYEAGFERVDEYDNLILLCPTHHIVVDKDNGAHFSSADLEQMKADHEADVASRMGAPEAAARELAERMAAAVEYWSSGLLPDWPEFTYGLLLAYPRTAESRVELLRERAQWLLARDWPPGYPGMAIAFARWLEAARLLLEHIEATFDEVDHRPDQLEMVRGHKQLGRWDSAAYAVALDEFLRSDAVLVWIVGELTRSTNLVISAVRAELDPLYRFEEGLVLVKAQQMLGDILLRLEFDAQDRTLPTAGNLTLAEIEQAILNDMKNKGLERPTDVKGLFLHLQGRPRPAS